MHDCGCNWVRLRASGFLRTVACAMVRACMCVCLGACMRKRFQAAYLFIPGRQNHAGKAENVTGFENCVCVCACVRACARVRTSMRASMTEI